MTRTGPARRGHRRFPIRHGGLLDTPARFVKAFNELTSGCHDDPAQILGRVFDDAYDAPVTVHTRDFLQALLHDLGVRP